MQKINKQINTLLHTKCKKVSLEEGLKISELLLSYIDKLPNSIIGLAANQIGINASVCVIKITNEPLILINPEILEFEGLFQYSEGCLSFKNKKCIVNRYSSILIKCENYSSLLYFDVSDIVENNPSNINSSLKVLEICAVQHEIDHLNGITMLDKEIKENYNRNDKISLEKDGKSITVKYKKLNIYLEDGWKII